MIELSFVIPCFNSEKTIQKTLASVFEQKTDFPFEVIVVDNGSKDKTVEIVSSFPVRLLFEKKRGPNHARNLGLEKAQGEYIAFIDSDVVLESNWAQTLLSYAKNKKLLAAQGRVIRRPFQGRSNLLEKYRCFSSSHPTNWLSLVTQDYRVGFMNTAACIYKKEVLKRVRGFSQTLLCSEDVDLTLKVRSLPDGRMGSTGAAVAYCYFSQGYYAYLKRAFYHGCFTAFLRKKWSLENTGPSNYEWTNSSLLLFDWLVYSFFQIGQKMGRGVLFFRPSRAEIHESLQYRKIGVLPKTSAFNFYFEDQELISNTEARI